MSERHINDNLPYGTLALICSLLVTAIGLLSLVGLVLGVPRLATLGFSPFPMAPSTALLLTIQGIIGLPVACGCLIGRKSTNCLLALSVCCSAVGGTLFVLALLGIYPEWEYLGIQPHQISGKVFLHHMSPMTSLSFVGVGISFVAALTAGPDKRYRALLSFWIALVLEAVFSILFLAYLLGTPWFYGGFVNPPAATTALGFMTLCLTLVLHYHPIVWPDVVGVEMKRNYKYPALLMVLVLLVAGIVNVAFFFHQKNEKLHLEMARNQLSAIAELKVNEIAFWRSERFGDASFYYNNRSFAVIVKSFLHSSSDRLERLVLKIWLANIRADRNYCGIFLFDPHGRNLFSSPGDAERITPYLSRVVSESFISRRIVFSDFYRAGPEGKIFLSVVIPVFDPVDRRKALAAMVLRVDPERYLYPFISSLPIKGSSAETLIVRRDGNDVLYLNELRFYKNSALNFRIPLNRVSVPAVMAVLGRTGSVEGVDYRGVPVLAELRPIPDSPWYLVARMNISEIYMPLRERALITLALVFALLMSMASGVGFFWKQRNINFYRQSERDASRNRERLQCLVNVLQYQARDIQALLDYSLAEALRLTGSHYGYVYRYNENKRIFVLVSWSQDVLKVGGIQNPASESELDQSGLWGETVRQRKAIVINDFSAPNSLEKGYPEEDAAFARFMSVPIIDQGRIVAVSGVANKETDYDDSDVTQFSLLMDAVWKVAERKRFEDELGQKSAELERFTYAISHDLKSPLVTISAFLGYLETDIGDADKELIRRDMSYIRTAADRMGLLLGELLELLRVGWVVSNPVWVNFQDVVQESLQLLAGPIIERGVRVTGPETRIMLFADHPRLVEICQNLVENAVKYMGEQADPCIEIDAEQVNGETVFFVRDNGMGIDERFRENIFGMFNKLDACSDGSGLGLALTKRIVEMYGGNIWVESEGIGSGSCFRFTLPKALERGLEVNDQI